MKQQNKNIFSHGLKAILPIILSLSLGYSQEAKKIDETKKIFNDGVYYFYTSRYEKSIECLNQGNEILKEEGISESELEDYASSNLYLGHSYYAKKDLESSLEHFKIAEDCFTRMNNERRTDCILYASFISKDQGKNKEAINYMKNFINLKESLTKEIPKKECIGKELKEYYQVKKWIEEKEELVRAYRTMGDWLEEENMGLNGENCYDFYTKSILLELELMRYEEEKYKILKEMIEYNQKNEQ